MTETIGSQELVRIATAYLASFAFGVTFIVASLSGVDGLTTLGRSIIAVLLACLGGQFLLSPVVHCVLNAMARDEAERKAALEKAQQEEEEA